MTEPKILIVNKDNKVVGSESRKFAHKNELIHRVVRIFLFNSKGQLFLQLRTPDRDNFPGLWDQSVGGHVDEGEDNLEAALREAQEEIGLHNVELKEVGTYYTEDVETGRKLKRFNTLYTTKSDMALIYEPEEVADGKWVTIDELQRDIEHNPDQYTLGLIKALRFYREHVS